MKTASSRKELIFNEDKMSMFHIIYLQKKIVS